VIPLRFLLLVSMIIPISLKVTIDVTKYAYAMFIDWDNEMYDAEVSNGNSNYFGRLFYFLMPCKDLHSRLTLLLLQLRLQ
jgi:magnesium-transporting ATPase (P-type)